MRWYLRLFRDNCLPSLAMATGGPGGEGVAKMFAKGNYDLAMRTARRGKSALPAPEPEPGSRQCVI
jgi:hypothetical protein